MRTRSRKKPKIREIPPKPSSKPPGSIISGGTFTFSAIYFLSKEDRLRIPYTVVKSSSTLAGTGKFALKYMKRVSCKAKK